MGEDHVSQAELTHSIQGQRVINLIWLVELAVDLLRCSLDLLLLDQDLQKNHRMQNLFLKNRSEIIDPVMRVLGNKIRYDPVTYYEFLQVQVVT